MGVRVASRLAGLELSLIRQVQLAAGPGAINLGLGEPTLPAPEPVRRALLRDLERGSVGYTLTAGDKELRARIAASLPHHGAAPDSVLVTSGSQEALALSILGLCDPGDELLAPSIAYPAYGALASIAGARLVPYPVRKENGFRPRAADIVRLVTPRTRILLLGSPANPTGAVIAPSDVRALESLAEERGFHIVSDEIYGAIYLGGAPPAQPRGNASLVISGLSKSHALTGLRTGWLVGPPPLLARLLPLHQQLVLVAPTLAQRAALAALDLGADYAEEVRAEYRLRWQALSEALAGITGLDVAPPDGAFYALVDARARIGHRSKEFALETARTGGVVVVPGEAFGSEGRGYLRISYAGTPEEIREGMARLSRALDGFKGSA